MGIKYLEVPVDTLIEQLHLSSLETRCGLVDHIFIHGLVNGRIVSSALLAKFILRVPGVTRSAELFVQIVIEEIILSTGLWKDFIGLVIL